MHTILAEQFIRKMRGGSQPALLRCDDGFYYVVKFVGNPQHTRVLVNDYLASKIAAHLGLPVPEVSVVRVNKSFIRHSPQLIFEFPDRVTRVAEGLHLAIRYAISPHDGQVMDFIPPTSIARVANIAAFAGMLAFDLWTGNTDQRQVVYWKRFDEWALHACFIDQGFCFGGTRWEYRTLRAGVGLYSERAVYHSIRGWGEFEPYLSAIESTKISEIKGIAREIPKCWYGAWSELSAVLKALLLRRLIVRDLLWGSRAALPVVFTNWTMPDCHQTQRPSIPEADVRLNPASSTERRKTFATNRFGIGTSFVASY